MLLHKLNDKLWRYVRYWERMETLFTLVRSILDGETSYDDHIKDKIHTSMVELEDFRVHIIAGTCDPNEIVEPDQPSYQLEPYLLYKWHRWAAILKMNITQPWKKAPRRTFADVDYPSDPGDLVVGLWEQWKWADAWKSLPSMLGAKTKISLSL